MSDAESEKEIWRRANAALWDKGIAPIERRQQKIDIRMAMAAGAILAAQIIGNVALAVYLSSR